MRSLVVLALVALAVPVDASHCAGYTTSAPEVDSCGIAACFYVDYDPCPTQPCSFPSLWIYEESNGILGLQREDPIIDDTCHGSIRGDTIIF